MTNQYPQRAYGGGRQHDYSGGRRDDAPDPIKAVKAEWLGEFSQETLEWAEETGKTLQAGKVTTAQLRKFFGSLRRLEQEFSTELGDEQYKQIRQELLMLKPRLAYSAARAVTTGERRADKATFEDFVKQVSVLLDALSKTDNNLLGSRYKTFVHILEAVVAYHKLNGGN